jgi:hypothetical protein
MKYITGIHALNLPCSLLTCGDWHQSAIQWKEPRFGDTTQSVFGAYGIDHGVSIPGHTEKYDVANHIRALLDLLEQGVFSVAQGMNKDFICNSEYTEEVFDKVSLLHGVQHWPQIDRFMGREYAGEWLAYKRRNGL